MEKVQLEMQRQRNLQTEERRLREIDRKEALERLKKQEEYKRLHTLATVSHKAHRVKRIQESKSSAVSDALQSRLEFETQRLKDKIGETSIVFCFTSDLTNIIHIEPREVGPGEHIGLKILKGKKSPSWSFGIPHEMDRSFC